MRGTVLSGAVLALLVLSGCGGIDRTVQENVDLSGSWRFAGPSADFPYFLECTEDLEPFSNFFFCFQFDLDIVQEGAAFGGDSPENFCGYDTLTVSGVVEGPNFTGELTGSTQSFVDRVVIEGQKLSDESFFLIPVRFTSDGYSGRCTFTGHYNGRVIE